ncbi:THAP domain-containing protein 6-like [Mugil cephalus]|uniref:THAP domain-containing protein 6-like n=1 Tax=Mugil cephalus TaxID=48193 RepID=UPI001FB63B25|nr:THAP domain-containing protein 6-like [Mugil cephalus]XP_047428118.1 THAP domain-containing protein 6-like [Mugil cephalus]
MPDFCAAYGCSNERSISTKSRGITFHRFPKDSILRRQWEQAVQRKDFVATARSLLCSQHFKPEEFDMTGQTVRLRHGVTPSVFNFPSHLRKEVASTTTMASIKAEESLPVDVPQYSCDTQPHSNVDHNYALPASPTALKARLGAALARVESLEREKRNGMIRERRARKNVHTLLEDLREKNLINEELKDRLKCFSDLLAKKKRKSRRRAMSPPESRGSLPSHCTFTVQRHMVS